MKVFIMMILDVVEDGIIGLLKQRDNGSEWQQLLCSYVVATVECNECIMRVGGYVREKMLR